MTCAISASKGQIIFFQNCSRVLCFCLTHEHSRAEIFSFGEEAGKLFALYPVRIFDGASPKTRVLEGELRSLICLLALI